MTRFKELFRGRNDCYGLQKICLKAPLTDEVILTHLRGEKRIGIYPIFDGEHTNWIAVDLDKDDFETAVKFADRCKHYGLTAYIERSKSRGYHIWTFFDKPVLAINARLVIEMILKEIELTCELFPKQDAITKEEYGNFIYLPLFGADTRNGRTVFVNFDNEVVISGVEKLGKIQKTPAEKIKDLVELNDLKREAHSIPAAEIKFKPKGPLPCIRKMLEGGLSKGSGRDTICYRLSIYYKDKDLSEQETIDLLRIWNNKNIEPLPDKKLLQHIQSVIKGDYKGIGCEDPIVQQFCDKENCPLIQAKERKKAIDEGLIVLTFRNKADNVMVFNKKEYEFRLNNIHFAKDGSFKTLLTLSKNKIMTYKDIVNLNQGGHRKRFAKAAEDPEIAFDLMKIEELVKKQILKEIEEEAVKTKQLYVMTEVEKKEAIKYLENHQDLLYRVIQATNKMGAVGEESLRCIVYLCFTSRITMDPISVTAKGESASGKSFICQCIKKLIPEEGYKFMTRATQQAFYHLEEDGMQHKIFYINELPGSESADYSIRSAQSEGDLILLISQKDQNTGEIITREKRVKGPVGFLVTTTQASIFDENETRNFSIYTDDSPQLTRRIKDITIRKSLGETFTISDNEANLFKNFQRLLNPEFKVRIPFAKMIFEKFPDKPVRIRRDINRFRVLLEIVVLLHQFHRKQYKENNQMILEATLADYYLAKRIAGETLLHTIYEIGPTSKTIWFSIWEMKSSFEIEGFERKFTFKYRDISNYLDWKNEKVKKWTLTLLKAGLIEYAEESTGGRGKAAIFQISKIGIRLEKSLHSMFLPSVEDLWKDYPCDEKLFYDPFTGKEIDPFIADAPFLITESDEMI